MKENRLQKIINSEQISAEKHQATIETARGQRPEAVYNPPKHLPHKPHIWSSNRVQHFNDPKEPASPEPKKGCHCVIL